MAYERQGRDRLEGGPQKTTELLEQEGLPYAPDTKLRSLNVSDIQMIEILKAVSFNADIIIMDEPTSAITSKEVERLFEKIEQLKRAARASSISRTKWMRFLKSRTISPSCGMAM